ncbi:MAG: hypothetical protein KatS3mg014_2010 [Actinomycetota bacterium]|nr:MAG: hypothetical protein KatS3mg014_2010 [Actinomycetota bacterium]
MRNVTVTLDDETARWARIEAASRDMSLSRFIREILRERMEDRGRYEAAMRRYLTRRPAALRRETAPYPTRDELHDRAHLR